MTDAEWVSVCRHAVYSGPRCWYRPSRIEGYGHLPAGPGREAVYVNVTSDQRRINYRVVVKIMAGQIAIESMGVQEPGSDYVAILYWDVPGNVRDLALSIGREILGLGR